MRKLVVFNNVTLDGYFTDQNGDMSWAHSGGDTIQSSKHSPRRLQVAAANYCLAELPTISWPATSRHKPRSKMIQSLPTP